MPPALQQNDVGTEAPMNIVQIELLHGLKLLLSAQT